MSLDAMYGVGSLAAYKVTTDLTALFAGAVAVTTQVDIVDGSVHLETHWTDSAAAGAHIGRVKIECWPLKVHYGSLQVAPVYRSRGIYKQLIAGQPAFWKGLGVKVLSGAARPGSRSEYVMKLGGLERRADGNLETRLDVVGHMLEIDAWHKAGDLPGTEPAWHATLITNPVAGTDDV